MVDEQAMINEAFENILQSYLSSAVKQKITARYGEAVAVKVQCIHDDALFCPVDWRTATMDTALPILLAFLTNKYPWLSDKAKSNINYAFIMAWK